MHSVTYTTADVRQEIRLTGDAPDQPQRQRRDSTTASDQTHPEWTVARLRAALARTDRPVRARALAHDLGIPSAEVTAHLRRLQDLGLAASHDRRWTAVPKATSGSQAAGTMAPATKATARTGSSPAVDENTARTRKTA